MVALIFIQRNSKHKLPCQRAAECLADFPTPKALSQASEEDLRHYFRNIGLQGEKPGQLIKLSEKYLNDPPKQGIVRSKKGSCPDSEITHLPQIGLKSVDAWWVYFCEKTDILTQDTRLLEYMEYLKSRNSVD